MKLFKVCKTESKSLWENKIKIIAIIAIIFIPLLYTFSYLKAYWDPYGDLKNYHVAIVNNDTGATLDGENVNYGNDTVKKLKDKKDMGFDFVNSKVAYEGIKNDKYFALIEIPADFSSKIANAKNGTAVAPTLKYVSNNKKNYIGTKISSNIKSEILSQMKQTISEKYGETAFDSIYQSRDGFKDASSGTEKIISGTQEIIDGNNTLTSNLNDLSNQVPKLKDGTSALSSGASALTNGLGQLNSKIPEISNGVNQLSSGADTLNKGLTSADQGAATLASKSKDLTDAGKKLNDGVSSLASSTNKLTAAGSNLSDTYTNKLLPGYTQMTSGLKAGADQLTDGAKNIQSGVNQLIKSTSDTQKALNNAQAYLQAYLTNNPSAMADPNMQAYLQAMQTIAAQAADPSNAAKITALSQGTDKLVAGAQAMSSQLDTNNSSSAVSAFSSALNNFNSAGIQAYTAGVNQYTTGANQLASGVTQYTAGVNQYTAGVIQLSSGLDSLSQCSSKISTGLSTLNSNMPSLTDASSKLYTGSSTLNNGIIELNSKMPSLVSGAQQLTDGSTKIGTALTTLNSGQTDLQTGLTDGIKKINDNVKSSSKDLGSFVSDPVKVDETNVDPVNNYGSGLAPYFLPISLWLGAVLMMLILKIKNDNYNDLNSFELTIGKYIHYAGLGIIQAILLGCVVLVLGIKPTHPVMLFGFLIVAALSFDAILYALVSLLGLIGEGAAIILLVLQLCSDAGTFPSEVLPKFFQNISTFLPFTYVVRVSRELLFANTINTSLVNKDLGILCIFGLVSICFAFIFCKKGEAINNAIEEALGDTATE